MATSLCSSPLVSFNNTHKPGLITHQYTIIRRASWIQDTTYSFKTAKFEALKAAENKPSTKSNSILCTDCEGNGAKKCSQCEGTGINLVDHFNGRFKAGAKCWICSGRKEVLCGDCNGAGFIGGFLSRFDEVYD